MFVTITSFWHFEMYKLLWKCVFWNVQAAVKVCILKCTSCCESVYFKMYKLLWKCVSWNVQAAVKVCILKCTSCCKSVYLEMYKPLWKCVFYYLRSDKYFFPAGKWWYKNYIIKYPWIFLLIIIYISDMHYVVSISLLLTGKKYIYYFLVFHNDINF